MLAEVDLYGVYIPGLLALMLVALVLNLILRRVFALAGVYAFVWHRGLFDLAIYILLLGALTSLTHWSMS